jgi:hypothetical protein
LHTGHAVADVNIWFQPEAAVTLATFHAAMSPWLNRAAALNMFCMRLTLAVFHAATFWLNQLAALNIETMFATRAVFHAPMFWLKALAPLKMLAMLVTAAVFHLLMSALNVGLLANTEAKLVTAAVFQSTMFPYVVASPPIHAVTAVPMLAFVMGMAV